MVGLKNYTCTCKGRPPFLTHPTRHTYSANMHLKIAAVSGHKLLWVFLALLSIQHHPPQTLIEVSVVEGKIMPCQLSGTQDGEINTYTGDSKTTKL